MASAVVALEIIESHGFRRQQKQIAHLYWSVVMGFYPPRLMSGYLVIYIVMGTV